MFRRRVLPYVRLVTSARRSYVAKAPDHANKLKEQRIKGFRWQDSNVWRPHRKYDEDPTSWNRAEKAAALKRPKNSAELLAAAASLTAAAVEHDPAQTMKLPTEEAIRKMDSMALNFRYDTTRREQHESVVLAVLRPLIGPEAVASLDALHTLIVALRDPAAARVTMTERSRERLNVRMPQLLTDVVRVLQSIPVARWSVFLQDHHWEGAVALSDLLNDVRLTCSAVSSPELRRQVAAPMSELSRLLAEFVDGHLSGDAHHSAAASRVLGNIILLNSANVGAALDRTRRVIGGRTATVVVADSSIEHFAASAPLLLSNDQWHHLTFLFAMVESSCAYWARRTKLADSTYVWGNIDVGVSSPVPPPTVRYLCVSVRHMARDEIQDAVGERRMCRLFLSLLSVLQYTPNHALPLRQIALVARARVHLQAPLEIEESQLWAHVFSRGATRYTGLSREDLLIVLQVLSSKPFRDPRLRASVAQALHDACAALRGDIDGLSDAEFQQLLTQLACQFSGHLPVDMWRPLFKRVVSSMQHPEEKTPMAPLAALVCLRGRCPPTDVFVTDDKKIAELCQVIFGGGTSLEDPAVEEAVLGAALQASPADMTAAVSLFVHRGLAALSSQGNNR